MIINVLKYLEDSEKRYPSRIAFAEEQKNITYSELADTARRIGTFITRETHGARREPIVVFVDRNVESLVMFMGIAYSGNFYVPIDKQMPKKRIDLILETLKPIAGIVLLSDLDYVKSISPELITILYEDAIHITVSEESLARIRRKMIDMDPLYATFTSGSTGIPKGVLTCHRSVIDMTEALADVFEFSTESIFGNQNPFYFDASIKDIYSTLKAGATMFIIPKACFVTPTQLVDFLNKYQVNTVLWSAAAIALVANLNAFEVDVPNYLQKVMFSGEVMHNKVLNYWRSALPETMFVNLYGPTEITSVCTYFIVDRQFKDEDVLPIGIPFKNTEIFLINEENKLVKGDEVGEICVRGCCLALGYYRNFDKTREAFCQNPLNASFPETIYRTGDLARYDNEGQLVFLTRKDNQVKHMGQRVELGEIEIIINSLELVDASFCFYDHERKKIVLIYQGENANRNYILNEIKNKLPKYMFPNIMIQMIALPYNMNGKIDRTLLKDKYHKGEIS